MQSIVLVIVGFLAGILLCMIVVQMTKNREERLAVEGVPGWSMSNDQAPYVNNYSIHILTDPNGKKFLVLRNGGSGSISMLPYEGK